MRFGHNSDQGGPDLNISRHAGSIRWDDGLWVVCNDSATRPFDVIVRGVAIPLPPRSAPESRSVWAIGPPGLEIHIVGPTARYLISISVDGDRPPVLDQPEDGDQSTRPVRKPTDRERLLLAAKFLALSAPGDAVGNREAAQYASAARPSDAPITERTVDNCAGRWCRRLQDCGATGISGRENINQLGRQLLAWGVLRQEDRELLRPPR